ncbi:MAG: tocopherol cyclase family protein [Sphaerochaetaceae bacterium]
MTSNRHVVVVPGSKGYPHMGLHGLFHPPVFQGRKRTVSYFEGWYFKMAVGHSDSASGPEVISVIPGIALGSTKDDHHAFIQVISSREKHSWYVPFPLEAFNADKREMHLTVGNNLFTTNHIQLDLRHEDLTLSGSIRHHGIQPFPVTLASPGIMGWFAYLPFMECNHGVVSTHHSLSGSIECNGIETDFTGGTGYIEKDWGTSFPEAWIWMQSNCFPSENSSCMLSVARIPILGRSFTGFLGFLQMGDRMIRFGTYTGARIVALETNGTQANVAIRQKDMLIEFTSELGPSSHLAAPRQGKMDRTITESILGTLAVTVHAANGTTLFKETGTMAGIELSEAGSLR